MRHINVELTGIFSLLAIALSAAFFWACVSVIASGVKSATGSCGSRYPIDRYVAANLFCVEGK